MRRWRTLHTWFGLCAGIFVLMSAVTGIILTVGEMLPDPYPWVPAELVGPPVSADEAIRIAEAEVGAQVGKLSISHGEGEAWIAEMKNGDMLFIAPGGEIYEHRQDPVYTPLMSFAIDLHTGGIAGNKGHLFMIVVSAALAFSVLSGVLIWPWLRKRMKASERAARGRVAEAAEP